MTISFIGGGNRSTRMMEEIGVPGENHRPTCRSHWQAWSHNLVSSAPRLSGIRTQNVSGDMHLLNRYLEMQLPYDHDHDDPSTLRNVN